jgi:hypothetical protein
MQTLQSPTLKKKRSRRSGETFLSRTDSLRDSYILSWIEPLICREVSAKKLAILAILVRTLLALTVRILLLLSRLLAATLLLARLL